MNTNTKKNRTLMTSIATAASLTLLAGCNTLTDAGLNLNRAPPEVGNRFLVGAFELLKPADNYGYTGEFSPSEQALRERSRKFDRTVWQGALIGAVTGTAIGLVAGGDAEDAVGGAIVGAGLGALAGMYVANKQKQYSKQEEQLESITADVRGSNRELNALIAEAKAVVAADKKRLADIESRHKRGKATEAELKQVKARVWSNRDVTKKAAQGARDQYAMYKQAHQDLKSKGATKTRALEKELDSYRKSLDALDKIAVSVVEA